METNGGGYGNLEKRFYSQCLSNTEYIYSRDCYPANCGNPIAPPNSKLSKTVRPVHNTTETGVPTLYFGYQATQEIMCEPGYVTDTSGLDFSKKRFNVTCDENAVQIVPENCYRVECGEPNVKSLGFGEPEVASCVDSGIEPNRTRFESTCDIKCASGWELNNTETAVKGDFGEAVCNFEADWQVREISNKNNASYTCTRRDCGEPTRTELSVEAGFWKCSAHPDAVEPGKEFRYGANCELSCEPGWRVVNRTEVEEFVETSAKFVCQADGTWSNEFRCRRELCHDNDVYKRPLNVSQEIHVSSCDWADTDQDEKHQRYTDECQFTCSKGLVNSYFNEVSTVQLFDDPWNVTISQADSFQKINLRCETNNTWVYQHETCVCPEISRAVLVGYFDGLVLALGK